MAWSSSSTTSSCLHPAFAQLGVAHDLGDDPVRALDLLLDDPDLLARRRAVPVSARAAREKAALLMMASGFLIWCANSAARRPAERSWPSRKANSRASSSHALLALQQHLHAVAADGHQQQQSQPQQQRLGGVLRRARPFQQRCARFRPGNSATVRVDDAGQHVAGAQREVEHQLRGGARHAHRAADDQRQETASRECCRSRR